MSGVAKYLSNVSMAPATTNDPMEMVSRAVQSGASPETLEKLLELQERYQKEQSRRAFVSAMAIARKSFGPILKTESGYANRYKYETLASVADAVDCPLSENGFSYEWETQDLEGGKIRVTCIVTHEAGHEKRNSLVGSPQDTASAGANMNGFQRLGGAVTYLQRYTLKAALGLAASEDTDACIAERKAEIDFDEAPWLEKIENMTAENLRTIHSELNAIAAKIPQGKLALLQGAFAARQKRIKEMEAE